MVPLKTIFITASAHHIFVDPMIGNFLLDDFDDT